MGVDDMLSSAIHMSAAMEYVSDSGTYYWFVPVWDVIDFPTFVQQSTIGFIDLTKKRNRARPAIWPVANPGLGSHSRGPARSQGSVATTPDRRASPSE